MGRRNGSADMRRADGRGGPPVPPPRARGRARSAAGGARTGPLGGRGSIRPPAPSIYGPRGATRCCGLPGRGRRNGRNEAVEAVRSGQR